MLTKKRIDIDRIKELYHDGVSEGIEDGKYFSFKEWFYQYKEDSEEWEDYGV